MDSQIKNSLPKSLQHSLAYAASWVSWGTTLAVNTTYSTYQYARGFLIYEHNHVQHEEKQAKNAVSTLEYIVANGLTGAIKGTVAAAVIYSGASWPVIGLMSLGLLPKETMARLGKTIFGTAYQASFDIQHLSNHALSIMHAIIPTNWLQIGLKTGVDALVKYLGSESLTQFYNNFHIGERIWLWTGVAGSVRSDLKMLGHSSQKTTTTEFHNDKNIAKVTDTSQCEKNWFSTETCKVTERRIIEEDLLTHSVRDGRLVSHNNGESWVPVSYHHVTDNHSYHVDYVDGQIVKEVHIPNLPHSQPPSSLLNIVTPNAHSWASQALAVSSTITQILFAYGAYRKSHNLMFTPFSWVLSSLPLTQATTEASRENINTATPDEKQLQTSSATPNEINRPKDSSTQSEEHKSDNIFSAIDKGLQAFEDYIKHVNSDYHHNIFCKKNENGDDTFVYAIKTGKTDIAKHMLEKAGCHIGKLRAATYDDPGKEHAVCIMIKYSNDIDLFKNTLIKIGSSAIAESIKCNDTCIQEATPLALPSPENDLNNPKKVNQSREMVTTCTKDTVLTLALRADRLNHAEQIIDRYPDLMVIAGTEQKIYSSGKINIQEYHPIVLAAMKKYKVIFKKLLTPYAGSNKISIPMAAYQASFPNVSCTAHPEECDYLYDLIQTEQGERNKVYFLQQMAISPSMEEILASTGNSLWNSNLLNKANAIHHAAKRHLWKNVAKILKAFDTETPSKDHVPLDINTLEDNKSILYYIIEDQFFGMKAKELIEQLTRHNFDFPTRTCKDMAEYVKLHPTATDTVLELYDKNELSSHLDKCLFNRDIFNFSTAYEAISAILNKNDNTERKRICNLVHPENRNHLIFYITKYGTPREYSNFFEKCETETAITAILDDKGCSTLDYAQLYNPTLFTKLINNITNKNSNLNSPKEEVSSKKDEKHSVPPSASSEKNTKITLLTTTELHKICGIDNHSVVTRAIFKGDINNIPAIIDKYPQLHKKIIGFDNYFTLVSDGLTNSLEIMGSSNPKNEKMSEKEKNLQQRMKCQTYKEVLNTLMQSNCTVIKEENNGKLNQDANTAIEMLKLLISYGGPLVGVTGAGGLLTYLLSKKDIALGYLNGNPKTAVAVGAVGAGSALLLSFGFYSYYNSVHAPGAVCDNYHKQWVDEINNKCLALK